MRAHVQNVGPMQLSDRAQCCLSVRYITIEKAAQSTGYTLAAIRTKIRDGIWAKGDVWTRAPDGRILIDIEGYNAWASRAAIRRPRNLRRKAGLQPAPARIVPRLRIREMVVRRPCTSTFVP